jgi:hypothetical protein
MEANSAVRTPDQKFVTLFEAAKRSLLATEELKRRLATDLHALEPDLLAGIDVGGRAISPLLSAISFVDFAHRFGSLVDALPRINKKSAEMRRLQQRLVPIEEARNHLQHLRGDLSADVEIDYALLGELGWTNGDAAFFMALTDPHAVEHFSIAFDAQDGAWTAKHRYLIKNSWIDVDRVCATMRETFEWIASKVKFSDDNFGKIQWGNTFSGAYRVTINGAPLTDKR